jgi:hypothetical protein
MTTIQVASPHPQDERGAAKDSPKKDTFERILCPVSIVFNTDNRPKKWNTPMKRILIRYRAKPDLAQQNRRLIENVFEELQEKSPEGLRYMVLKLGDDTFLHFVETRDGTSPLQELEAFRAFQSGIRDRCAEPPQANEAIVVGNYRMLGER